MRGPGRQWDNEDGAAKRDPSVGAAEMSLEFLITALIVVLVPGTGVVYTVAIGLSRGRIAAVAAALGCTFGIVPSIAAAILGLSALMHAGALAFQVLKYAGAAYLFYLAWQTLRETGPVAIGRPEGGRKSLAAIARTGCLINVLNPKLTVFFLAFLPQFVSHGSASATAQMLAMSAVFMAMTFAVFVVYGAFAALFGEAVLKRETVVTWMRRSVALAFAGFGVKLALASR
ncbi:threonine/homoserine/homoserine lactone efflux protein [Breoghania corrubedonensis]|uniref:Threonine/homoserine/homoserine lactone efflux protein n=2 Tax=Breoghania corrubedonensis TaxID=665038 RepID=A0A2T5VGR5_9HYPH|nr:threonine/homoserine/homoserine lactone efflux protein [Breoghania corrubedonensis]